MDVKVCHNVELDLSESFILEEEPSLQLNGKVKVNGVGVFDDNGRILPLISKYLSYQSKHEKISYKSAGTYGKNLVYFLNYIRNRSDYSSEETDEVFITVPKYVIQEYLSFLDREEDKSSATVRNRDATIRAFIEFLCNPTEDREPLRENNPYINGYLSKAPKRTPINACTLDELTVLIESTQSERERALLQFLFDSGIRRSELPRITFQNFKDATSFNSENFISQDSDQPIHPDYVPVAIKGSKCSGQLI